jgi:(2Fe-2S) ferredoxin
MNNAKANVIIAMKMCGMEAISEGGMYHALFSQGLDADDATHVVKELLEEGKILRSGCAFILNRYVQPHGEEGATSERTVCNS